MHIDARFGRISWIEDLPIVQCLLLLFLDSSGCILLSPNLTLLILFGHLLDEFDEVGSYFRIGFEVIEL